MLTSMTGFGRAVGDAPLGRLTVEIHSLNRKYLEVFTSFPKELSCYEHEVRKKVAKACVRGQISIRITLAPTLGAIAALLPDAAVLKGLKKGWDKIAKEVGADPKEVSLPFIMEHLPSEVKGASSEDLAILEACVDEAVLSLAKMKKEEGQVLLRDLTKRLEGLGQKIQEVERSAPDAANKMRAKLLEKMHEVFESKEGLDERLFREVALFAEKVDITEEITRFKSHTDQFRTLFKESGSGRKMDFLLQEMNREVNTIGSKSMQAQISHIVVEMKSELEKMREQVQNIE